MWLGGARALDAVQAGVPVADDLKKTSQRTCASFPSEISSVGDASRRPGPRRARASLELQVNNSMNDEETNRPSPNSIEVPASAGRSRAAERMRRHRARRRLGCRCVQVEVAEFDVAGLVRLGHLDPRERDDPIAIGDALYRLFDQTIARR